MKQKQPETVCSAGESCQDFPEKLMNLFSRRDFLKTSVTLLSSYAFLQPLAEAVEIHRRGLEKGVAKPGSPLPIDPESGKNALRFTVVGDWGWSGYKLNPKAATPADIREWEENGAGERSVAAAMGAFAGIHKPHMVVSVGDNFYPNGVKTAEDERWLSTFEQPFAAESLQVPWYVALGNHDIRRNWQAQIDYTKKSKRWNMPAKHYTFKKTAPDGTTVRFFVLDTCAFHEKLHTGAALEQAKKDAAEQLVWLEKGLASSKSDWKVIIGHHPIWTGGVRRDIREQDLDKHLPPLMKKHGASVYFCGHEHDSQHIERDGIHNVLMGNGGDMRPTGTTEGSLYAESRLGFGYVTVDKTSLRLNFIDSAGAVRHTAVVARTTHAAATTPAPTASGTAGFLKKRARRREPADHRPVSLTMPLRHTLPFVLAGFALAPLASLATTTNILYAAAPESEGTRTRESFDSGWSFARFGLAPESKDAPRIAEPAGLEKPGFDDASWRKLDLPHDWGIEGPFRQDLEGNTGKLPWRGIGWYRKSFTVPTADKGRRTFLDFDGAMANAKVWINGKPLPAHPYGYTSFRLDLTPYLNFGDKPNVVAVRLDTENWDSRWYPGAGIYRHTWLVKTNPVHIEHYGTTVTTPAVSEKSATVRLVARVQNESAAPVKASVRVSIHEVNSNDAVGARVAGVVGKDFEIAAGGAAAGTVELAVPSPALWSPAKPNRYLARTLVVADGKVVDSYDTPVGFRTLEFTARDGFKLNGERLEIQGVCQHHDLGALGAALNNRALQRQLEALKDMGCNAIRTSHNPPATELLDLADKMGFLVQVEAFDCWEKGKRAKDYNKLYKEWHETDLKDMVKRARNHPSVFMWSIGNEIMEQTKPAYPKHLTAIVKSEDTTRPVTAGCNNPRGAIDSGFAKEVDIMGVNYFMSNYGYFESKKEYSDKPYMSTESASVVSSRGEYFFPVKRGKDSEQNFQVSSYDVTAPGWAYPQDDQFRELAKHPACLGEFVWTGWDYLGEPTPYNNDATNLLNFRADPKKMAELEKQMKESGKIPVPSRSSYFGIIDLAGFPKDRFYAYKSHWNPSVPTAHLLPHWNWPERVGQVTPVHLYTSGDEAELFLNGKSLGRKKKGKFEYRIKWDDVKYTPGELKVVAYKNGKEWATETVKTTGEPARLALASDRAAIKADGKDLAFVTVRIADKEGLTVPRSSNLVKFSVSGPGEIVATDNGDATSFESFQLPQHKAFNGLALAIVRLKPGAKGKITVTAESAGLAPASVAVSGL